MQLFNTASRSKEPFVPLRPGKVNMYVCGVTVYDLCHIGHARSALVFDVLVRFLRRKGLDVTFVRNFTDVDDKIIRRANEEGRDWKEVAETYIKAFHEDMDALGVLRADVEPRATEYMDAIIALCEELVQKGFAYATPSGDVYFAVRSFPQYGKLSHRSLDDMQAGARVAPGEEKRDPMDFAVWKAAKPGEPFWDSPWGKGRPGWHIECSAMSNRYLGTTMDIHCGGSDLIFPHHENEIAQSEAANDAKFVNYWVHNGFINVDNKKMSKSLGNFFTVREAAEAYGYDCIRMFMLMSHYRSPLNYSGEILMQAKAALERLSTAKDNLDFFVQYGDDRDMSEEEAAFAQSLDAYRDKFCEAMDDDFNTANAISAIYELVREINARVNPNAHPSKALAEACRAIYLELSDVLGIPFIERRDELTEEQQALFEARKAARKEKNWAESDRIRDELKAQGILVEDTPQGMKWKRA